MTLQMIVLMLQPILIGRARRWLHTELDRKFIIDLIHKIDERENR